MEGKQNFSDDDVVHVRPRLFLSLSLCDVTMKKETNKKYKVEKNEYDRTD